MEKTNEYSMIITTCSDMGNAKDIAKQLIDKRLAACVQMFPIASMYVWKDEICGDNEILLFIKTKSLLFDKAAAVIKENHTYEVPEIIQVPIIGGLPEYLKWIGDTLGEHQ